MARNKANDANLNIPLKVWTRGDPLRANRLTRMVKAINRMGRGIQAPLQIPPEKPSPIIRKFRFVEAKDDYLICKEFDRIENQSIGTESQIFIAKDYLNRRTPFEAGGESEDRGGITYVYTDPIAENLNSDPVVDAAPLERNADNGTDSEDQVIIPSYQKNDIIVATRNIQGGTGVIVTGTNGFRQEILRPDSNLRIQHHLSIQHYAEIHMLH